MSTEDYIEKSIQALEDASQIYVRLDCSMQWAESQHFLGVAYLNRKQADLEDNLQKSIIAFSGASQIYHILSNENKSYKYQYLKAKFNLGIAYEQSNQIVAAYQSFKVTIETSNLNRDIIFDNYQVLTEIYSRNMPIQVKREPNDEDENIVDIAVSNNVIGFVQGKIFSEKESQENLRELNNQLYQSMVRVCIKIEKYAEAVEYAEQSKTRILIEMQAIRELNYQNQDLKTSSDDLLRIQKEYETESRRVAESNDPNHEKINNLRQEFIEKFPYKTLEFAQIQKLAPAHTALVEWYTLADSFCVFLITNNSQPYLLSFTKSDLDQLITWRNEYLTDYYTNREAWQNKLTTKLANLTQILHINDILQALPKDTQKLTLIPHRYLHLFPLHALPVTKSTWQHFHPDQETSPPNPHLLHLQSPQAVVAVVELHHTMFQNQLLF